MRKVIFLLAFGVAALRQIDEDDTDADADTEETAPQSKKCDVEEVLCYGLPDGDVVPSFCASVDKGCPPAEPTCKATEHRCVLRRSCEDCYDTPVCLDKSEPCPVQCAFGQHLCFIAESGRNECRAEACPVQCAAGQHKCVDAPAADCQGAGCQKSEYCIPQSHACPRPPLACRDDEVDCIEGDRMFCAPAAKGCPLSCPTGQHKCTELHSAVDFCLSNAEPCPCPESTHACYSGDNRVCLPLTQECPLSCPEGQKVCSRQRQRSMFLLSPLQWCATECAEVTCAAGQRLCHGTTCVPKDSACPLQCAAGFKQCPNGDGAACFPEAKPCPAVCGFLQHLCVTEEGRQTCVANSVTCPSAQARCSESEVRCQTPKDGDGTFRSFCRSKEEGCPGEHEGN